MKKVKKFQLKIVIFTAVKNRCMLHARVFVMKQLNSTQVLSRFAALHRDTMQPIKFSKPRWVGTLKKEGQLYQFSIQANLWVVIRSFSS